jgi:hypothetical protein
VDPPQWFAADEPLEGLDAEGELADGERSLAAEAAIAEALEVLGGAVLGAVDDAQVLAAAALEGRLDQALGPAGDEVERLNYDALAAGER